MPTTVRSEVKEHMHRQAVEAAQSPKCRGKNASTQQVISLRTLPPMLRPFACKWQRQLHPSLIQAPMNGKIYFLEENSAHHLITSSSALALSSVQELGQGFAMSVL